MLASASPRRRELLGLLGLEFEVVEPGVEELDRGDPPEIVLDNARRKALAVADRIEGPATILAADTEVVLDGTVLGKPADAPQAREYLRMLAGRTHTVLTGVAVLHPGIDEPLTGLAESSVGFGLTDDEFLDLYVASGEWEDKAGGYAVQGLGSALIERVDGDLSNVIGLPLRLTVGLLGDG